MHDGSDDLDDDDDGVQIVSSTVVVFYCSLPPSSLSPYDDGDGGSSIQPPQQHDPNNNDSGNSSSNSCSNDNSGSRALLNFHCREPSCGALQDDEIPASWDTTEEELEHYGAVDPNFFEGGYTMAATTGFKVWTGTRLLIETLGWPQPSIERGGRLMEIQQYIMDGANVLELGAGVGVVGTYLSYLGANVLLTDLPTLVKHSIRPNLLRNASFSSNTGDHITVPMCPPWLRQPNCNGLKVGRGWAACTSLDWTVPIREQLSDDQIRAVDFIVASDVVFLLSMLHSLMDTVAALFNESSSSSLITGKLKSFVLSFQRRDPQDGEESTSFTTVNTILTAIKDRGWTMECLSWRPVTVQKETCDGKTVNEQSEVFVFEIRTGSGR